MSNSFSNKKRESNFTMTSIGDNDSFNDNKLYGKIGKLIKVVVSNLNLKENNF